MYYVAAAGHDTLGDYNEVVLYRTEDLEEAKKFRDRVLRKHLKAFLPYGTTFLILEDNDETVIFREAE